MYLCTAGLPAWGFDEGLPTPHLEKPPCYEMLHRDSVMVGCCEHGNEPSGSLKVGISWLAA